MKDDTKILCDFNDKLACKDEILFDVGATIKYIKLLEEFIVMTNNTRKSYIEYVYKTDRAETHDDLIRKQQNMKNDLRLQFLAERFDYLKEQLEDDKIVLNEQRTRLLRINKLIEMRVKKYPFLKKYEK